MVMVMIMVMVIVTVTVMFTFTFRDRQCIAENQSWLLVVFPRRKNNIVENIW